MKLLFLPGSGGGRELWIYQTEYFTDAEAIALPGHPDGEACDSVDEYVEWLHNYVNQQGYEDVVLIGHSLGGAIAQLYGLKYGDEVKALVLSGTGARLRVRPEIMEGLKGMIGDDAAWRKSLENSYGSADPKVSEITIESRARIGPAVALSDFLCCNKFDIMEQVQNIRVPSLVLCGSEDTMTPIKYSDYLTNKIEGAEEVIIEGATHAAMTEKPKEYNQAIENFLAGLR
jgi:pimeloyl-ACP methyl ester carboxylesterase